MATLATGTVILVQVILAHLQLGDVGSLSIDLALLLMGDLAEDLMIPIQTQRLVMVKLSLV